MAVSGVACWVAAELINLYGKYGDLDSAARVESFVRDVDEFSLSALISGYANAGRMREARRVFEASDVSGEKLWRLPLEESYWETMKSGVANM